MTWSPVAIGVTKIRHAGVYLAGIQNHFGRILSPMPLTPAKVAPG